jgi:hypothetical protein
MFMTVFALPASFSAMAQNSEWTPVTGADILRAFMSGRTMDRDLVGGGVGQAEYHADGTGLLRLGGTSYARTWEIKGESQICIMALQETACYEFESNTTETDLYRARDVRTNKLTEFRVTGASTVVCRAVKSQHSAGHLEHQFRLHHL